MTDSPTPDPESAFICECDERMRSACAGEPFYKKHRDQHYCVLHYPADDKTTEFRVAVTRKLNSGNHNFSGVWFPEFVSFKDSLSDADFGYATFCGDADFAQVDFGCIAGFAGTMFLRKANFKAAQSGLAIFTDSQFHDDAIFSGAEFLKPEFASAHFRSLADFSHAEMGSKTEGPFSGKSTFIRVRFESLADFRGTQFHARGDFMFALFGSSANFRGASFEGSAKFPWASFNADVQFGFETERKQAFRAELDLDYATIHSPELIRFTNVTLRPSWFVNVTARKFEFRSVHWDWKSDANLITPLQVRRLKNSSLGRLDRRLLARSALWEEGTVSAAYRELALNAEENHRYEEASKFRYMAMDARRRESLLGFAPWRLSWWYWLASGYGERASQAFSILLGIWFLSALLYNHVGFAQWEPKPAADADVITAKHDEVGVPLKFSRALTYSAGVMTLQRPEPRPATTAAQTVVLLETVLGPVQAALLALAIRRKFMR